MFSAELNKYDYLDNRGQKVMSSLKTFVILEIKKYGI